MTAAAQTASRGRPALPKEKTASFESDLYKLLQAKLPQYVKRGRLNIRALAEDVKMRPATVYRWCSLNRLTSPGANAIIDVAKGKLTPQDLAQFLI